MKKVQLRMDLFRSITRSPNVDNCIKKCQVSSPFALDGIREATSPSYSIVRTLYNSSSNCRQTSQQRVETLGQDPDQCVPRLKSIGHGFEKQDILLRRNSRSGSRPDQ